MAAFEQALWPLLGLLLFATFTQIPLLQIKQGLQDTRFIAALLIGNFVVIPALLGVLVVWIPLPLPIALTLPNGWQAAVVIIVCQSLVELLGMVAYLRWVPKRLIPSKDTKKADAHGK